MDAIATTAPHNKTEESERARITMGTSFLICDSRLDGQDNVE